MTLTMNELLSPGFITAYILGFIFLVLTTRFLYDSFSEYWEKFIVTWCINTWDHGMLCNI